MSSNKDFLPSSSPIPSICAIEIEAALFPFHDELLQVFIPRMYYNYRIENRENEEPAQPPHCLLQLQEKMVFHLPWSGCLGTSVTLPQSLYGRTDGWMDGRTLTSEPKFFGSTGYQICLPMVLRELRYKL